MTWLIVGGKGQLGRALTHNLMQSGIETKNLSRSDLDITNLDEVLKTILTIQPKVIVNTAAWTDVDKAELEPDLAFKVNSVGPKNLAIAAGQVGSILVQISSDYVFSGEGNTPWGESDSLAPISTYGETKAQGETYVRNILPDMSYIVRTAWLYSEFGRNFVKTMLRIGFANTKSIPVVNDQLGQPTSAHDLSIQIIKLLSSHAAAGVYHGTNSGQATWFDFAREVFTLANLDVSRISPVPSINVPRLAKRPSYSVLGHSDWKKNDLEPMRDWREGLGFSMPAIISAVNEGR